MKQLLTSALCLLAGLCCAQWPNYQVQLLADSDGDILDPQTYIYGANYRGVSTNNALQFSRIRQVNPGTDSQVQLSTDGILWQVTGESPSLNVPGFGMRLDRSIITESGTQIVQADDMGPFVWGRHGFFRKQNQPLRYILGLDGFGFPNTNNCLDASQTGFILMMTRSYTPQAEVHVFDVESNKYSSMPYSEVPISETNPARINEFGDFVFSDFTSNPPKGRYKLSSGESGMVSINSVSNPSFNEFYYINWDQSALGRVTVGSNDHIVYWSNVAEPGEIIPNGSPWPRRVNPGGWSMEINSNSTNDAATFFRHRSSTIFLEGSGSRTLQSIANELGIFGEIYSTDWVNDNGDFVLRVVQPGGRLWRHYLIKADWTSVISGTIMSGPANSGDIVPISVESNDGPRTEESRTVLARPGSPFRVGTQATGSVRLSIPAVNGSLPQSVTIDTTQPGATSSISLAIIKGDVDGDGEIGPGDFEELVARFGAEAGSSLYTIEADIDRNGEVGPSDFEIVVQNFGLAGS